MNKPRLLVACEKSRRVASAFEKRGWEAWSCDILPAEVPGNHIQDDVLKHLDGIKCSTCHGLGILRHAFSQDTFPCYECNGKGLLRWDMLIAHPPCTKISRAGARWLYHDGVIDPERLEQGKVAVEFFLRLYNAPIDRKALENPTPMKIFNLPMPSTVINPHDFGEPYSKRTLLWLVNLPPLMPTLHMADFKPYLPSNTGYGRQRGQKHQFKHISAEDSARTFVGIAEAMASQWGSFSGLDIREGR